MQCPSPSRNPAHGLCFRFFHFDLDFFIFTLTSTCDLNFSYATPLPAARSFRRSRLHLIWAAERHHPVSATMVFKGEPLPHPDPFDLLVMMGGYMSVYEEERHPWLVAEKATHQAGDTKRQGGARGLPRRPVDRERPRRGGPRHMVKEIGWFPVTLTPGAEHHRSSPAGPKPSRRSTGMATSSISRPARRTASSEACPNQAFYYGETHRWPCSFTSNPRPTACSASCRAAPATSPEEPFVQPAETILAQREALKVLPKLLYSMLDSLASPGPL